MATIADYVEAAQSSVRWLAARQNPDGSVGEPETLANFCYKSPYALAVTGRAVEANRLLSWMTSRLLDGDGELSAGAGTGRSTYRVSWIAQGAFRLARFDITEPFLRALLARQAPCGGFRADPDADHVETICTWGAMPAVYAGRLDAAARTAQFMASMVEQQPDPSRFYHTMTLDGRLRTSGDGAAFLDTTRPAQGYYHLGIPMLLLVRLYLATRQQEHLDTALKLFEIAEHCAPDAYGHTSAGKSMVAAAILHTLTGDARMRDRACQQADFLLSIQAPEGYWTVAQSDSLGVRIDATAEFAIFLTEAAASLAAGGTG